MNSKNSSNSSNSSKHVIKDSLLNSNNIVFDDFSTNENQTTSKIWYNDKEKNNEVVTLHIQTQLLKIFQVVDKDIIITLNNQSILCFEKIDAFVLEFVKSTKILKKLELKNIKYKTITNTKNDTNTQNELSVIKLRLPNDKSFFIGKDRTSQSYDTIKQNLTTNNEVKLILEIDSIVIDHEKNIVFTNVLLKQLLLNKVPPKKIELFDYSFIDSENENINNSENKQIKVNSEIRKSENIPLVKLQKVDKSDSESRESEKNNDNDTDTSLDC